MAAEARIPAIGSLAERRRDLVAGEIQRAALPLFATRGFEAVTVDDIATAAGISSRTFFRYFASKDDVVLRYSSALIGRLCHAVAARPPAEGAVTALREAFIATSTVAPSDRAAVRLQAGVLAQTPALQARSEGERISAASPLVALLAERMVVDPDADDRAAIVAASVTAAASVAFTRWVEAGDAGDPAVAVARAIDFVIGGLAPLDELGSGAARGRRQP